MTTTTNIAKFGARERGELIELLTAWNNQGLPRDFEDDEVTPVLNMESGYVFLSNSNYDVAMMNGDTLESFYSLPYGGEEGFMDDLLNNHTPDDLDREDVAFIRDHLEYYSGDIPEVWQEDEEDEEDEAEDEAEDDA